MIRYSSVISFGDNKSWFKRLYRGVLRNLKRRGSQFPVSVSTENIGKDQKKGHRVLRCPVSTVPLTGSNGVE